jgi:hypothetical protein
MNNVSLLLKEVSVLTQTRPQYVLDLCIATLEASTAC